MKVYLKLNLISAFVLMLFFVSCGSSDNTTTTPPAGFAPSNVTGMNLVAYEDAFGGSGSIFEMTFISNNSGKVTKYFVTTEDEITTNLCVYSRTGSNAATIDVEIFYEGSWGSGEEKFKYDLTFTSRDGGTHWRTQYMKHSDGSTDTLDPVSGTFTLKK